MGAHCVQDLGPEHASPGDRKFAAHAHLKQLDTEEEGTFSGYAAVTGNVDLGDDVIEEGAFKQTLNQRGGKVPILNNHRGQEWIGNGREAREDNIGLFVRGKLDVENNPKARAVHSILQDARDQDQRAGLSIGFTIPQGKTEFEEQEDGGFVRRIKEVNLLEYSIAPTPMNPEATVTDVKKYMDERPERKTVVEFQDLPLASEDREWSSDDAVERVREWAGGPDKEDIDFDRYARAFLWFDSENADNFGAYKLPIADAIDGELTAVPRGIFAAAAAIQGARGGVDIPDGDVGAIKNHLARYYDRMDRTPPWEEEDALRRDVALARDLLACHGYKEILELPQAGSKDGEEAHSELLGALEGFAQAEI